MASRWDGRIGKVPSLSNKRETKRVSFRLPKGERETEDNYSCRIPEYEGSRTSRAPRPPGSRTTLLPEQVYNYKSQYARYERALDIRPDAIREEGKTKIYKFHSCDAPTGFWEVSISEGASFLKLAKTQLTIVCPQPYQLSGGESDGEEFVWQQLAGNKSIFVEPPTSLNPVLNLQSFCDTLAGGCDSGTALPILLKVSVRDQPELFDNLIIYNTPTSTNYGCSFEPVGRGEKDCKKVKNAYTAPLYPQRAYELEGNSILVTWDLPKCDQENLVSTTWQINTNGQYVDVDEFAIGDERLFDASLRTHYRIKSTFNIFGIREEVFYSRPIVYNPQGKIVLVDDTSRGVSFRGIGKLRRVDPSSLDQLIAIDRYTSALSFAGRGKYSKSLSETQILNARDSSRGASFAKAKSRYKKFALGSVVIG